MKSIVMIIGFVFMMGCMLDQEYQEAQYDQYDEREIKERPSIVEYIYIDCEGNVITDPAIIEEIKTSKTK